ncbi:hypothetical protein K435DRAFT_777730 [Dendrothele bispora CBS 962.96]|uniref:F-box domain-containing protein n=1 Tax=Dendrothele bispora (strain CBS 962.96) TaxID=1314807 RepID=A0A4S8M7V7_DENBC|nr:hypothetical protein K435DRAFT_777730 [Dendrothele bispora CBS 962.96]
MNYENSAPRPRRPKLTHVDVGDLPEPPAVLAGGIPSLCPPEVLRSIFENLDHPSDLLHVILTSRMFYEVGLPVLYRSVEYTRPYDLESNLSFWGLSHTHMNNKVFSVTVINIETNSSSKQDSNVDDTGIFTIPIQQQHLVPQPRSQREQAARSDWTEGHLSILNRHLPQFTNLTTLTFAGIRSSESGFVMNTLRLLPRLTKLAFINCKMVSGDELLEGPSRWPRLTGKMGSGNQLLEGPSRWPKLTELTIWNCGRMGSWSTLFDLMRSGTLRVLHIDWDPVVLDKVSSALNPSPDSVNSGNPFHRTALPSSLRYLQVRVPHTTRSNDDGDTPLGLLAGFVATCRGLIGLAVMGNYMFTKGDNQVLDPHKGRWSFIREYSGPSELLPLLAGPGSQLESLKLLEGFREGLFEPMMFPRLRSLSLRLHLVCPSVFHKLVEAPLKGLEELRIEYDSLNLNDSQNDTLRSLAALFLFEFPVLAVFHLYPAGNGQSNPIKDVNIECSVHPFSDRKVSSAIQEVLESPSGSVRNVGVEVISTLCECHSVISRKVLELSCIACWRLYCPHLREVQLAKEFVWRRKLVDDGQRLEHIWSRSRVIESECRQSEFDLNWMSIGQLSKRTVEGLKHLMLRQLDRNTEE